MQSQQSPLLNVFCLQAKLLLGRHNLYGNSLEFQVKYIEKKIYDLSGFTHFLEEFGKNALLGQKQCFLGKKCPITWNILIAH